MSKWDSMTGYYLRDEENLERLIATASPMPELLFSAPEEVDPRKLFPQHKWIENQASQGSCFRAGTLVRLADGRQVPIEKISILDKVSTAEGRVGTVMKVMAREYSGEMCKVSMWGHKHLSATTEHPFLTKRGYVEAKNLESGDWVAFPRFCGGESAFVQTAQFVEVQHRAQKDRSWTSSEINGRGRTSVTIKQLPDAIKLNYGFGRIVGLFLAEGSTSRSRAMWTFSKDEEHTLVAELRRLLDEELGVESSVKFSGKSHSMSVRIYGTAWAQLFAGLCGTGAGGKSVHGDLMTGPREFLEGVYSGWMDGDGHKHERGHRCGTTISHVLAAQMFDIANGLGLRPSMTTRHCRISHGVKTRQRRWEVVTPKIGDDNYRCQMVDGVMWRRVIRVDREPFSGMVFNLNVSGDNSYVAENVGVHNCAGHACTTILEFCLGVATQAEPVQLSRQYCYIEAQKKSGIYGDRGSTVDGNVQVATEGVPEETFWPYTGKYVTSPPNGDWDACRENAKKYRLAKHSVMKSYDDCFNWIAGGTGGVDIGIRWGLADAKVCEFYRNAGGGHSVAFLGYTKRKDTKGRNYLLLANSWGPTWGDGGWTEVSPTAVEQMLDSNYTVMIGMTDMVDIVHRPINVHLDW